MNESVNSFLDQVFLGNTIENYLWCAGILFTGLVLKNTLSKLFTLILYKLIKRFSGSVTQKEFYALLSKPFTIFLFLIIGYIAFSFIDYPDNWKAVAGKRFTPESVFYVVYKITIIFTITWILLRIVDFFGIVLTRRAELTESRLDDQLVPFFRDGVKILLVIMTVFFILAAVFNVNIVTLIGGLGIGGLAVALAAQETLENLLGSFTIFLDKPFIVGDLVREGEITGRVEAIGLRSTRIRTLERSLVTVPNKRMVDAELENLTERSLWRIKFAIGILYSTRTSEIENIIKEIRQELAKHNRIDEDFMVRLDSFGASSFDITIVFLVRTGDYSEMMEVKEEINFKIINIVRNNNTDFAFPSTSLYVEKVAGPQN